MWSQVSVGINVKSKHQRELWRIRCEFVSNAQKSQNRLVTVGHLECREDVLDCQYNSAFNNKVYRFLGTLVYDGEVYDHMRYRIRGHGSTYNTGKNKWKWRFNRGRLFQGRIDGVGNGRLAAAAAGEQDDKTGYG